MFARVSTISGDPQNVDRIGSQLRETVLPPVRQLAGFKGVLAMVDRSSGKSLTVTLWDSEQAMEGSEQAANKIREDTAGALGEQIMGVERFEVVLDER